MWSKYIANKIFCFILSVDEQVLPHDERERERREAERGHIRDYAERAPLS